jgi:hypothetical protein
MAALASIRAGRGSKIGAGARKGRAPGIPLNAEWAKRRRYFFARASDNPRISYKRLTTGIRAPSAHLCNDGPIEKE